MGRVTRGAGVRMVGPVSGMYNCTVLYYCIVLPEIQAGITLTNAKTTKRVERGGFFPI